MSQIKMKQLSDRVHVSEPKVVRHARRKQDLTIYATNAQGDDVMVVIKAGAVWKLFQFLQGRYWV